MRSARIEAIVDTPVVADIQVADTAAVTLHQNPIDSSDSLGCSTFDRTHQKTVRSSAAKKRALQALKH